MKDKTTIISVFIVCLLLCIANITTVAINKRQDDKISALEKKFDEIKEEIDTYKSEVENLAKELKKLENEITGIKEQTDKIAKQLIEVETREEAQEELKAATEEEVTTEEEEYIPEKTIVTEAPTTEEVTEDITTQRDEINITDEVTEDVTEGSTVDIPWVVYEVVECEVHGGDKESKMHVAHVIRNRVNSDLFPNDYYTVCTSPYQFGSRSDVEASTIEAVNEAMTIADTTGGALFFHSMDWMSSWGGYSYIFTDNVGHHFYGN